MTEPTSDSKFPAMERLPEMVEVAVVEVAEKELNEGLKVEPRAEEEVQRASPFVVPEPVMRVEGEGTQVPFTARQPAEVEKLPPPLKVEVAVEVEVREPIVRFEILEEANQPFFH